MYRAVRLLGFAYGTVMLYACTMADRMIFMPPTKSYSFEEKGAVRFGEEGQFGGFYFPARDKSLPTLLWAHGNAEDAGYVREVTDGFQEQGFGIMIYDFPGYGRSEGKPSEEGTYRSADAAFDFLTNKKGLATKNLVLLGQSLGSGPSVYLAEKEKAAGLVLISPFKSTFRVVTRVKILPWDRFDNLKRLKSVTMPLLVIHGSADNIVPATDGQTLYEKHRGKKDLLLLEGVGHNDIWSAAGDEVTDKVSEFALKVVEESP